MRHFAFAVLLIVCSSYGSTQAQTYVGGNVFSSTDDTPLPGASVTNLTSGATARATPAGTYVIEARDKDVIVFSFTGMEPDTLQVQPGFLKTGYDAALRQTTQTLKTVTIISSYQLDSLRRREEYGPYFKRGPGITGRNRPENGFGLSFSPVSHFSKKARERRKLRKRLIRDEKEAYIDYVFSPGWVSKQTGLKNDTLQQFMYRYRPSYEMARTLDRTGMLLYIHKQYKDFVYKPE